MSYPPGRPGPIDPRSGPYAPPAGPWGSAPPPASPPGPGLGSGVSPALPGGADHGAVTGPQRRRRGPLRILARALVVLLVISALAGTTAWGFTNRSSAQRWQERSEAADADLRRSLTRVETTDAEIADARQRLRDVAAEKAGETDRNRILSDIVTQAPAVTEAMRECQEETTSLANDLIDALGQPDADLAGIQRRTRQVDSICEDALAAATELEDSIDELDL